MSCSCEGVARGWRDILLILMIATFWTRLVTETMGVVCLCCRMQRIKLDDFLVYRPHTGLLSPSNYSLGYLILITSYAISSICYWSPRLCSCEVLPQSFRLRLRVCVRIGSRWTLLGHRLSSFLVTDREYRVRALLRICGSHIPYRNSLHARR